MMAWAGAIYVDPPEPPGKCFGEGMLNAEMTLAWMAMGFFFFSTLASVVFYMDIDGIPPKLLLQHLWDSQLLYSLPTLAVALDIFMTALAYGIDIGERGGCKFFIFGVIAAPCFVGAIVVLWLVCWHRRKKLFEKNNFSPGVVQLRRRRRKPKVWNNSFRRFQRGLNASLLLLLWMESQHKVYVYCSAGVLVIVKWKLRDGSKFYCWLVVML